MTRSNPHKRQSNPKNTNLEKKMVQILENEKSSQISSNHKTEITTIIRIKNESGHVILGQSNRQKMTTSLLEHKWGVAGVSSSWG